MSQGEQGTQGVRGRQGEQGPINVLSKWQRYALIIWITIFSVLTFYSIRSNRQNVSKNRALILQVRKSTAKIKDLEKAEKLSCKNFSTLRDAVDNFHGTLGSFLKTAEEARRASYKKTHNPSDLKAANIYKRLRLSAKTVTATCAEAPLSK